jgi:TorA maturation chaperone TorD
LLGTGTVELGLERATEASGPIDGSSFASDLAAADRRTGPAPVDAPGRSDVDDVDLLRSHEYSLLALLLGRAPSAEVLAQVAALQGDATPLGLAHIELGIAAADADPDRLSREYFDLFVGVGRGELLPYASYYLTGFLHERPLARVREDLEELGIERAQDRFEPEDHLATLCEVMAGLAAGRFTAEPGAERRFFERHLATWAPRFFADLETAKLGRFYRPVGTIGRLFMAIEAEAFAMDT